MGAIYGQLAGAFYGVEAIPEAWRKQCSLSPLIELFADELCRFSENIQGDTLLPQDISWLQLLSSIYFRWNIGYYDNICIDTLYTILRVF